MALKHAVLGLLADRSGYGYELVQRLERRLGPAWRLSASSVYAALDQLEEEGLIESRSGKLPADVPAERRRGARRLTYELTTRGRKAYRDWMVEPSLRQEPIRSDLSLRLASARAEDAAILREAVHRASQGAMITREECLADSELSTAAGWEGAVAMLSREAVLARVEAELRWLQLVDRTVADLSDQGGPTAPVAAPGREVVPGRSRGPTST